MPAIYENILHILVMLGLLACSAFFSAAETAFFNLSHRQTKLMEQSSRRFACLAAILLRNPRQLLGSLLLANCIVNVAFYSLAAVLTFQIAADAGPTAAAVAAVLALAALLLLGEMVPKSLAYINSRRLCVAAAIPAFIVTRILSPLQFIFNLLLVEPVLRLLLVAPKSPRPVTQPVVDAGRLKLLIESSRQKGLISPDENQLLSAVVEFGFLKVRHVVRPRVDMQTCDITTPPCQARRLMKAERLTKLPVYSESIDNIVGLVYLRDLLLEPAESLHELVRQINFVPEQKTVESLLQFFRRTGTDIAIAVDEYGGITGCVYVEDIVAELLGPTEPAYGLEPVQQIGPMKYRLAGSLPIHDWADAFGIDPAQSRLSTIGGLVTALLGRIPHPGDIANMKNLSFTVEKTKNHRIETVILSFEAISR